jgi:hypothetical protein
VPKEIFSKPVEESDIQKAPSGEADQNDELTKSEDKDPEAQSQLPEKPVQGARTIFVGDSFRDITRRKYNLPPGSIQIVTHRR